MEEKEIRQLVEETTKVNLKNYVRDAIIELNAEKAAEPEPEWSKHEGLWARAVAMGITDGERPCAAATRCEVIAMLGRYEAARQREKDEAREKAEELGMD